MVDPVSIKIFALIFLIIATAYFVVSEFAFVKVRPSRIEQLVAEGNKKAVKAQKVINNLDGYLSACQLGITITALGIGWLGEPTVAALVKPLFEDLPMISDSLAGLISFIIAFSFITFLHVVMGELAPKTIAIQKAEFITLNFASSMIWFHKIMYPFIWALNGSALLIVKAMGMTSANEHNEAHSEEEIKFIVSTSKDINNDEKAMVEKIFDFDETITREIMVHRKDMDCIYLSKPIDVTLEFIKNNTHSRFPVVGDDKDDIKGYVNIRDLYSNHNSGKGLEGIIRAIPKVYESTPIKKVLSLLQKEKTQIAVVLDEYGGVAGLVTIEDIIEEIVGDIQDEFDNEVPAIRKGKNRWIVEGDAHIEEVEKAIGVTFENKKDVVTIGGFVMNYLIEADQLHTNTKFEIQGKQFEILNMEEERILVLSISKE